jgi:malate/lactate dehydrogenase
MYDINMPLAENHARDILQAVSESSDTDVHIGIWEDMKDADVVICAFGISRADRQSGLTMMLKF